MQCGARCPAYGVCPRASWARGHSRGPALVLLEQPGGPASSIPRPLHPVGDGWGCSSAANFFPWGFAPDPHPVAPLGISHPSLRTPGAPGPHPPSVAGGAFPPRSSTADRLARLPPADGSSCASPRHVEREGRLVERVG